MRHPALPPQHRQRLRRRPSPWPPCRHMPPARKFPVSQGGRRVRAAPSPYLPDLSWCTVRELLTPMSLVYLPVSLAEPGPSGSTEPSRLCQGRLPPSPAPPRSGCPQLHRPAATRRRRWSLTPARSISASWRTQIPVQPGHINTELGDRRRPHPAGDRLQLRGDRAPAPGRSGRR